MATTDAVTVALTPEQWRTVLQCLTAEYEQYREDLRSGAVRAGHLTFADAVAKRRRLGAAYQAIDHALHAHEP